MANYAVNDWVSTVGNLTTVAAALETKLETIDSAKTIRFVQIYPVGGSVQFQAVLIWDA